MKSDTHNRHAKLSWDLLEHRFMYYVFGDPIISDYQYDVLELEYKKLSLELGVHASVCDMIGWDGSRPSTQLVEKTMMDRTTQAKRKK